GFTVREMVAMGRTPHRGRFRPEGEADRGAIEAAMRHADLLGMEERPYWALSGGERARVLLARALAQAAPILLLDEPTASLDLRHAFELLELVRSRAEAGLAALAALHDLSFAARFCDRLLVLDGARIVAEGPPEEVLTKALLAEVFGVRAELIRRGGSLLLDVQGRA
ncbi:MAG: ABC transporter ATP-binding protein, partial [Myxococcales bacterium]|nr:ABC transporter ATP-binding protein [Myxococcales bacterium]